MRPRPEREPADGGPVHKPSARPRSTRPFCFEIGWGGMFGLVVVGCCVLLWMFLLGIWAGQTILLPTRATTPAAQPAQPAQPPAQVAPAQTKR